MGDLQVWPQPNGILTEESAPSANPHPSAIDANRWAKAELRTSEIILCIQPTVQSEQKRNEVIEYVQRLLRMRVGLEVFAFGSVPLKTYLPDGDVDLTTISNYPNIEDKWANDVRVVLEGEEHNKLAEFRVKEVQYIHAEVKLVKCLVGNIVVDISFNQLGGLCTLCFLEKVDRLIGKDHLFKRSIILVKAWCYYESRILGAHHGLISTYALETLVLYIFHLFHASLHGPLEVLYRFLDYFSKFDWDNYCLSLQGPVAINPDNNAEPPETDGGDLLVSKKFLKECTDRFSFPPKGHDNQNRSLTFKNLNIIDPLRENNNLGRSVSKGNFYRIRSAFTYGAKKLGQILLSSEEKIGEELDKFFLNTVERHRNGHRPDVSDSIFCSLKTRLVGETTGFQQSSNSDVKEKFDKNAVVVQETNVAERSVPFNDSYENYRLNKISFTSSAEHSVTAVEAHQATVSVQINNLDHESKQASCVSDMAACQIHLVGNETGWGKKCPSSSNMPPNCSNCNNSGLLTEGNPVCGNRLEGDAKDLASSHSGYDVYKVKSPHGLPEQRTTANGRDLRSSGFAKGKAVSSSMSGSSKLCSSLTSEMSITAQGNLRGEHVRNRRSHEATVTSSTNSTTFCQSDDCKSASYLEQLSISNTSSIQHGSIAAKPRCMMQRGLPRDFVEDHKSVINTTQMASYRPALAAGSDTFLLMPSDTSPPLDFSSAHSSIIVHDSSFLGPGLCNNSIEDERYENGNIQEDAFPQLKINTDITQQGNPSCLYSSRFDGSVNGACGHPIQSDYSDPSSEEHSTSGKQTLSSVNLNLSDISRASESTSKFADVSFSSVDMNEALSVTQPNSDAGCSVPNMDQNLKWQSRTASFSGVSCFEGSNTPSCGTVTCSGMIPVGSVLDALRHLKADLDGDFDSHSSNLEYAKFCQESGSPGSGPPYPSLYMQEQFIQEGPARQFNLNTNVYPYMHGYRVGPRLLSPSGYIGGANRVILPGSFSGEELSKPRNGIGTFIPNMSLGSYKERYFNRGRNQGAPAQDFTPRVGNQMHRPRSNGRNKMNFDQNFQRQIANKSIDLNSAGVRSGDRDGDISRLGKSSYQLVNNTVSEQTLGPMAPEVYSVSNMVGHGKLINSVGDKLCNSPVSTMQPYSNGSDFHEQLEFGSFGPVQLGALSPGVKSEQRCMNSDELNGQWVNSEVLPASSGGTILEKSGAPLDYKREASWKEDDFPPLSFHR